MKAILWAALWAIWIPTVGNLANQSSSLPGFLLIIAFWGVLTVIVSLRRPRPLALVSVFFFGLLALFSWGFTIYLDGEVGFFGGAVMLTGVLCMVIYHFLLHRLLSIKASSVIFPALIVALTTGLTFRGEHWPTALLGSIVLGYQLLHEYRLEAV